jgi:hypothetical protein
MRMGLGQDRKSCGFMMETLEGRRLLTAGAVISDYVLNIRGSGGKDDISFHTGKTPASYVVEINDARYIFKESSVRAVKIAGFAGDDRITVASSLVRDPVLATGGPGRDIFRGIKDGIQYYPPVTYSTPFSFGEPNLTGELFYAHDYGAVGDGRVNDAPAIQAAIDAAPNGATVVLDAGKTYFLRKGLFLDRPVNIEGQGAKLLMCTNVSPENRAIYVLSRHSDISYAWSDQVIAGQTVFPVANATDLNVGDVVFLELGQDPNDPNEQHYTTLAHVLANDGASVTLDQAVPHDIIEGAFGNRITRVVSLVKDMWIRDLAFDHIDGTTVDANVWLEEAQNVTVENITGRFIIALVAADSTGVVLNNAYGDLLRTHPSSGRVINVWQSEVSASNLHVRTISDAAVVFAESWNRALTINGMEVKWQYYKSADNAVFHLTGNSSNTFVDNLVVQNSAPVLLAGSGAQTGSWKFGTLKITGPSIGFPVTNDLTYGGVHYSDLQHITPQIPLAPNQADLTIPLFNGLIHSIKAKLTTTEGVRWVFIQNQKNQGLELVSRIGDDWTEFPSLEMMGSFYPFNDPAADSVTLHICTLSNLPPDAVLMLDIEYFAT